MDEKRTNVRDSRQIKKITDKTPYIEAGKIPPQATDLEEAVLGALMLEKNALSDVADFLKAECFYRESHQQIFAAISNLEEKSQPIDILTVTQELKLMGQLDFVGGPYYISQLTARVASAANITFHARIIVQKYIQRELIRISSNTIRKAYEDTTDVFDLLDYAEKEIFQVSEGNIKKEYERMDSLLQKAITEIENAKKNKDGISGVPSGFTDLDRVTSGWQPSDLIIVAARPAMGKTAFVLSMARNIAVDFKIPVAIFSLEMSSVQLVNRLISSETAISSEKLRKGHLSEQEYQQLHARIGALSEAPLFIDDTPALSIFELRAKSRRLVSQHGVRMIVIDYLQLMTAGNSDGGNRVQEISAISRSLKIIAKELNVPIIALSQLSRAVETRGGDKKPVLSDLRESGSIEQDADMVTFLYRPEYYDIHHDENNNPTRGVGQVIIAKHRNGSLETISLRFIGELTKFTNLDQGGYQFDQTPSFQMSPNSNFDSGFGQQTVTKGSRMNDEVDSFGLDSEDPPF
ncbi:MAG TPA: replicative DNA helicase [Luteibaculaceae bacterium]|nr:replicative DNA helicase [Luteibaculaceae bacterium]